MAQHSPQRLEPTAIIAHQELFNRLPVFDFLKTRGHRAGVLGLSECGLCDPKAKQGQCCKLGGH